MSAENDGTRTLGDACCACLRIEQRTEPVEAGAVREYWACVLCGARFSRQPRPLTGAIEAAGSMRSKLRLPPKDLTYRVLMERSAQIKASGTNPIQASWARPNPPDLYTCQSCSIEYTPDYLDRHGWGACPGCAASGTSSTPRGWAPCGQFGAAYLNDPDSPCVRCSMPESAHGEADGTKVAPLAGALSAANEIVSRSPAGRIAGLAMDITKHIGDAENEDRRLRSEIERLRADLGTALLVAQERAVRIVALETAETSGTSDALREAAGVVVQWVNDCLECLFCGEWDGDESNTMGGHSDHRCCFWRLDQALNAGAPGTSRADGGLEEAPVVPSPDDTSDPRCPYVGRCNSNRCPVHGVVAPGTPSKGGE